VSEFSPTANGSKSVSAQCPGGKKALEGGEIVPDYVGLQLYQSFPTPDDSGWTVYAQENTSPGTPWSVRAFVVCG